MVTGVTGSGKSSACNFFCSEGVFTTNEGFASVTAKTGVVIKKVLGKTIKLIDTPGFCDEYESDDEHMKELGRAIFLARKGVHAIGFTINAGGRFTKNESKTFKEMTKFKEIWPFTFILFTNAGVLGEDEQQRMSQLQRNLSAERCPQALHDLIKCVNNRFILVESVEPAENCQAYYKQKVRELLQMIGKIHELNGHRLYTNELCVKASKMVEQAQKEKVQKSEQQVVQTLRAQVRELNRENSLKKRKNFETQWWTFERRRKSLVEKANTLKLEAIAAADKIRKAAIEKAEQDYKEAIAAAEEEASSQINLAKMEEKTKKKELTQERDKDIAKEENIIKTNAEKLKNDALKDMQKKLEEEACDEALESLKKELQLLRSQNKELMSQRNRNWYNTLSEKMTGKECVIQ